MRFSKLVYRNFLIYTVNISAILYLETYSIYATTYSYKFVCLFRHIKHAYNPPDSLQNHSYAGGNKSIFAKSKDILESILQVQCDTSSSFDNKPGLIELNIINKFYSFTSINYIILYSLAYISYNQFITGS